MGVQVNVCEVKKVKIGGELQDVFSLVPLAPELSITYGTWGWLLNKAMGYGKEISCEGGYFTTKEEIEDALNRARKALELMYKGELDLGIKPWTQEIDGEIFQYAGDSRYYSFLNTFVSICNYELEEGYNLICWG